MGGARFASEAHKAEFLKNPQKYMPQFGGFCSNGINYAVPWGAGGGWNDGTPNSWPDWLEVDFSGAQTIGEIDVFSVQDNFLSPSAPTPTSRRPRRSAT